MERTGPDYSRLWCPVCGEEIPLEATDHQCGMPYDIHGGRMGAIADRFWRGEIEMVPVTAPASLKSQPKPDTAKSAQDPEGPQ